VNYKFDFSNGQSGIFFGQGLDSESGSAGDLPVGQFASQSQCPSSVIDPCPQDLTIDFIAAKI
jgi:hypothetical protein